MGWHPSLGLSHDSPAVAALRAQMGRRRLSFTGNTKKKVEKLFDSAPRDAEDEDADEEDES